MLTPVVVDGKKLRRGYTTGMCAAAAAKGATIMLFQDVWPDEVDVATPAGPVLRLKICGREKDGNHARCCVIKDAGDDPDVTDRLAICAAARRTAAGVRIKGGAGVGVVTRPGLAVAPGQPAINPVPLQIIESEVQKVLPAGCGVEITISVPGGEAVAA
ncbi:MAG: cobalt-precorrin-5B (C(1))-methyltransferase, partial [Bacillota bacterium]